MLCLLTAIRRAKVAYCSPEAPPKNSRRVLYLKSYKKKTTTTKHSNKNSLILEVSQFIYCLGGHFPVEIFRIHTHSVIHRVKIFRGSLESNAWIAKEKKNTKKKYENSYQSCFEWAFNRRLILFLKFSDAQQMFGRSLENLGIIT